MKDYNIQSIDLIFVNLHTFKETILKDRSNQEEAIENINTGGSDMLLSETKNHALVTTVLDLLDYETILFKFKDKGKKPFN
jgi:phosphoribosylaminoimidazolecarboxamide formyltransferase/IMP cyclohydrolase